MIPYQAHTLLYPQEHSYSARQYPELAPCESHLIRSHFTRLSHLGASQTQEGTACPGSVQSSGTVSPVHTFDTQNPNPEPALLLSPTCMSSCHPQRWPLPCISLESGSCRAPHNPLMPPCSPFLPPALPLSPLLSVSNCSWGCPSVAWQTPPLGNNQYENQSQEVCGGGTS